MRIFWGLAIVAIGVAGCGSTDDTKDLFGARVCVPGVTSECACPGGAKGAQACKDDGTGYDTCQCASGSGGSAGSGGSSTGGSAGQSGSGGAGGSCSPRAMCPAPDPDAGAPLCGMLDDYCGGKLSCGCDFGECSGSACTCWRIPAHDQECANWSSGANGNIAVECINSTRPAGCGSGPRGVPGVNFPTYGSCCK